MLTCTGKYFFLTVAGKMHNSHVIIQVLRICYESWAVKTFAPYPPTVPGTLPVFYRPDYEKRKFNKKKLKKI